MLMTYLNMPLPNKQLISLVLLLSFPTCVEATNPPRLAETSDQIFEIVDGQIVVPTLDQRDQLTRPDLREGAEKNTPPLPTNFQATFFEHMGLQRYPIIWIFSPESGEVRQVKSAN